MLGQLYVDYEVELIIPQPSNTYQAGLLENSTFFKEGGLPSDSIKQRIPNAALASIPEDLATSVVNSNGSVQINFKRDWEGVVQ